MKTPSPFFLAKIGQALELPESLWTEKEILESTQELVTTHKQMASGLQEVVQTYHLGLGGERVDTLVIEEIHRLKKSGA